MTDAERNARVGAIIQKHLGAARAAGTIHRRHPAEVTSDRLAAALEKWPERFDGEARDEIAHIRSLLEEIAEEAQS